MQQASIILTLPVWIPSFLSQCTFPAQSTESRMRTVIALGMENVKRRTGGPFAAAVFESTTGVPVTFGVNRVLPCSCSIAHAEIMALGLAQQYYNSFSLAAPGIPPLELVTSTEPCAMCLGALPWSGIPRVICGATDADARTAGFDEGIKPDNWKESLEKNGIDVVTELCRSEAVEIFRKYAESGEPVYNGTPSS